MGSASSTLHLRIYRYATKPGNRVKSKAVPAQDEELALVHAIPFLRSKGLEEGAVEVPDGSLYIFAPSEERRAYIVRLLDCGCVHRQYVQPPY